MEPDEPEDTDRHRNEDHRALDAQVGSGRSSAGSPSGPTVRGPLQRIMRWVGLVEMFVGATLIAVIMTLVLIGVAQRYLPISGWVWTGEIARFGLVWSTFALAGLLLARDEHITLEVIDHATPPRVLNLVKRFSHLVVLVICLAMANEGYQLITGGSSQLAPASRLPLTWFYVIPFLGFVLTALRASIALLPARAMSTAPEGDSP